MVHIGPPSRYHHHHHHHHHPCHLAFWVHLGLHPGTGINVKCLNPAHDSLLEVGIYCKLCASQTLMASKLIRMLGIKLGL
jgi:hypothetical protein